MLLQYPIHHASFFLFIILIFSCFPNYSQSLTTQEDDERGILLSLKRHWGNPSSLHHWNSTFSPCNDDWDDISCNFNGSVTRINLSGMNLHGSFPSKIICQLTNLYSIYLSRNNLSGTIPLGLSTCSKLQDLDLSANYFTGKIPSELFSMKMLRSLNLQHNMFSGEISTIPMVAYSLEYLDLSYNLLNGSIPKDIGNLYNLTYLDLSSNFFISRFSRNSLSGPIPAGLLQLHQLSDLSLASNNLTGEIPSQLFSMKKLHRLNLGQNMLSGKIPTPRLVYNSLEYLDLSSNHLNGSIPDDIGNFCNLIYLNLSMNSLSGPIPATLLRLHQLYYLSLASNNLTGEIPGRLFNFLSLSSIDLSHNHLSGSIPRGFGELQQLQNIDVSYNKFSGDICGTVSHMWDARLTLRMCKNHFSGRIPYELVKLKFVDASFDDVNLCSEQLFSEQMDMKLPTCPSQGFSDYTIPLHINCRSSNESSKSKKTQPSKPNHTMIVTCVVIAAAAAVLIIGIGILILVFKHKGGRRKQNDGEEWSMVSFQRLEFNKCEIFGGLKDENLIGNGGSGKVYRVITKKGQRVAVKSIRHERKQNHILEKQFLAEVEILGGIRHNNIVKLLCCVKGNTTKLVVYEYMDKQCLHKWLHGKKKGLTTQVLNWETRLKIAMGATQGLCYMHHDCSPPIVHRDIKSSNILVDSDFNVKIADFGLAKMIASEGDPETASAVVGTFGYIAPEYSSTRKVDAKSDIYSFGVVLLELTTGREAVTGNEDMNLAQWARKHQREGNSAADALDEEIKDPRYMEAMIAVFKLGLACTLSSPSNRPSMKDISWILQRCSKNNHMSSENP
nr:systemin receptor SR160-like [Ipomoea trifida]